MNGVFQVVILDAWRPEFEAWLTSHGMGLFPMPRDDGAGNLTTEPDPDDLPTFGIGRKR